MSGRPDSRVIGRKRMAPHHRPRKAAHERLLERSAGVGEHPEELAGAHGSVLDPELFGLELAALAGSLAKERGLDTVADRGRQLLVPLPDGLLRDSDLAGRRSDPAKQLEGFGLGHVAHHKACFANMPTIISELPGTLSRMPDFGTRLTKALALADTSQRELAAELGISVQAVGQVISGKTKAMTAENTAKAARFLKISPLWLATGEGQPRPVGDLRAGDPEVAVLSDLRAIRQRAPMIYDQLRERIHTVAAGLASIDQALGVPATVAPHGAVSPPGPAPPVEPGQPEPMLGGLSGFGDLDPLARRSTEPATTHKRKRS